MAREVTHDATGPLKLDESDLDDEKGNIAICLCGLSENYPFCDGSHEVTEDEESGVRYKYEGDDPAGERREIEDTVFADESEES
jgi:CDGSH-type Zn-finger protein